ncbi:MAG: anthranilate synthase component I family protein, partial [Leptospiraceae bacterium]|nr:anthranilate synthase component I family protein [Leptospiraceae bacterium]
AWIKEKPPSSGQLSAQLLEKTRDKSQHSAMVDETLEEIRAGNTFQCQIGFQVNYELNGSTMAFYEALREVNPSPYMYYVKFGQKKIIGASPELVFRLRQGEMETYPLAGTTRRSPDAAEDLGNARALLNDPKEIAEHNMLVDLHRNDLGRVARFGTVKVRRLMDIRKFSHVQHISSEVVGIIRKDMNMFDGLKAVFPAGTLSGAPKVESMKIIERIEQSPRGPYGGAVGHFGWNGDTTFAIPIRTLFVNGNKAFARASGGIVFDSDPDYEFREIENKLAAIVRTLERFEESTAGGVR